jgi:hypothetical protein
MSRIWKTMLTSTLAASLLPVSFPAVASEGSQPTPDDPIVEVTTGQGPFIDDDGHVFELDIAALSAAGITDGCSPGRFCADEPVTRGEMAAFLERAFPDLPLVASPMNYADMTGSVFARNVEWLAETGITRGCTPDRFCPSEPVTRGQMAAFLFRAMSAAGMVDEAVIGGDLPFADAEAHFFGGEISWLVASGITAGCGADGLFCPDDQVTRGQMAAFLVRALDLPAVALTETAVVDLSQPTGPGAEGWRLLIEQFFEPEDVDTAVAVVACESHGDPGAANPRSSARGLFQHLERLWPGRAESAGFPGSSVYDPIANTAVAAWLVYNDPMGWHHWSPSKNCW